MYISTGLVDSYDDEMDEFESLEVSPTDASVTSFSVTEDKGRNYTVKKPVNVTDKYKKQEGRKDLCLFHTV